MPKWITCIAAATFLAALAGCDKDGTAASSGGASVTLTGGGTSVSLTGAGATFPQPLYAKWAAEYAKAHPNVRINYKCIGSCGGI
jgi:phosphate transport system substrate-binding protein